MRLGSSPRRTVPRFSERTLVVKDPLAEFFLLPPAAPETASLVEPLGARVVGLSPQLRPVVTPRPRLGEHGLDEPPADALVPALGPTKPSRRGKAPPRVAQPHRRCELACQAPYPLPHRRLRRPAGTQRVRCAHMATRPRFLVGRWLPAGPPGGIGRAPHRDHRLDVLWSAAPYDHLDHLVSSFPTTAPTGRTRTGSAFTAPASSLATRTGPLAVALFYEEQKPSHPVLDRPSDAGSSTRVLSAEA